MLGRALAEPEPFVPQSARRAFSLTSPDLFEVLAIPPLLERVRKEAPGVDLRIAPTDGARLAERLETGEIDVAVVGQVAGAAAPALGAGLVRRTLLRDRLVCVLRADHPVLERGRGRRAPALSLEAYAGASHIVVSPTGTGPGLVDRALSRHDLRRRVALCLPHFTSALAIVARSDLVFTAPAALGRLTENDRSLVVVPPPLRLPGHVVHMLWHERHSHDAGHRWLRSMLVDTASKLDTGNAAGLGP
jgi:DNA-binding transcriptional LysR family regulator